MSSYAFAYPPTVRLIEPIVWTFVDEIASASKLEPCMSRLPITIASWDYDRVRPITDGRVPIEGCDANYITMPVEEPSTASEAELSVSC